MVYAATFAFTQATLGSIVGGVCVSLIHGGGHILKNITIQMVLIPYIMRDLK